MSTRNHDRSPDKRNFSIALPKKLIDDIQIIAEEENRSRNRQIQHFLEIEVRSWKERAERQHITEPLSLVAESPNDPSSHSSDADGARGPVKYRAGRRRKS